MLSPGPDRAPQLSDNDGLLSDILARLASSSSYTLVYTTSPREDPESDASAYHPDTPSNNAYQDPIHIDLKRDFSAHTRRDDSDFEGDSDDKSLFEEYQYLSPGMSFFPFSVDVMMLMVSDRSVHGLHGYVRLSDYSVRRSLGIVESEGAVCCV